MVVGFSGETDVCLIWLTHPRGDRACAAVYVRALYSLDSADDPENLAFEAGQVLRVEQDVVDWDNPETWIQGGFIVPGFVS